MERRKREGYSYSMGATRSPCGCDGVCNFPYIPLSHTKNKYLPIYISRQFFMLELLTPGGGVGTKFSKLFFRAYSSHHRKEEFWFSASRPCASNETGEVFSIKGSILFFLCEINRAFSPNTTPKHAGRHCLYSRTLHYGMEGTPWDFGHWTQKTQGGGEERKRKQPYLRPLWARPRTV